VRKFYALVDEFHRMWDVVTEFDSLSNLASQMVPVSCCVGRATTMGCRWLGVCVLPQQHADGASLMVLLLCCLLAVACCRCRRTASAA
jgi:hypothetical protein